MVFEATARAVWEGASRVRGIPKSGSATLPTDNLIFIHREGYGWKPSLLLWEIDHSFVCAPVRTSDLITAPKKAGLRSLRSLRPPPHARLEPIGERLSHTDDLLNSATFSIDTNGTCSADAIDAERMRRDQETSTDGAS